VDTLLEAAMFSTWQERAFWAGTTEITAVDAVNDEFEVTDKNPPFATLVANDLIRSEGFAVAANNGLHVIVTATDTVLEVATDLQTEASVPTAARIHHVGRRAAAADITATSGVSDFITSTLLDFTTLGLAVGDWIKLSGTGGTWPAANNDWVRISAITATQLTFDIVPSGWATNGGAGATVDLFLGERIINGVTRRSYTVEKEFTDHSPVTFSYLRGMVMDGIVINVTPQSIVTYTPTFLGLTNEYTPTRFAGATTVAAPSTQVLNSSSNVGRIARAGSPITTENLVLEATLEISDNLRNKPAVGFLGASDIGVGEFSLTGALGTYFDSPELAQEVVDNTESSFDARFEDNESHVLLFDVVRLKWSEGADEIPGKNDDVTLPLQYQAIRHPVLGYTLKVQRFNYFA
jgi:hypothetical protein